MLLHYFCVGVFVPTAPYSGAYVIGYSYIIYINDSAVHWST